MQADLLRGSYIDPGRSRTALSVYADLWLGSLSVRPATRRTYDSNLRTWILPALGARTLASITPTDVRALVRQLSEQLALSTAHHVHGLLSTILRSAVEDGYLAANPAARTGPGRPRRTQVRPLRVGQVQALIEAIPERFGVAVLLGAGCGLRIGEVLGLAAGSVDLVAQEVTVSRQLQALPGQGFGAAAAEEPQQHPESAAARRRRHRDRRAPEPVAGPQRVGPAAADGDRPAGMAKDLPQPHLAHSHIAGRAAGVRFH